MGQTIQQDSFISQLQAIYRRINVLEYQQKKTFGNIVIDGNLGFLSVLNNAIVLNGQTGQISVYNGAILLDGTNGKITLSNGTTTMVMDSVAGKFSASTATGMIEVDGNTANIIGITTTSDLTNMFRMRKTIGNSTFTIARIDFRSRTITGVYEAQLQNRLFQSVDSNRVAYNGLTIESADGLSQTVAMQIDAGFTSNVFDSASLQFTVGTSLATFEVRADNINGTGYMKIPYRASDPTGLAGRMYYNTALGKFRIFDGAGWRSL